jgi:predicted RND superfamily exporter protein
VLERLLLALDRHPRLCQAVLAALIAWAMFQLPRLKIDDSPERWLPESTREAWRVLDEHFNFGDTIAVGFEYLRPIRDADAEPLKKFREKLTGTEGVRQVYDASLLAEDIEGVPLSELVDPANADRFDLYEGALWSPPNAKMHSQTLLMAIELYYPRDHAELHRLRRNVIDQLYKIVSAAKQQPEFRDVRFHLAGGILLMDELEQRSRSSIIFLPLSMLIGIASLLIGFRSLRALALTVVGGGAAMLLVIGYVAWSGSGLGALTISAPTLISIIAIATTVHFASDTADHGDPSRSPGERRRLVRWVAVPCLGVAILTAVGFLMLAFNDLSPVRSLGYELFAGSLLAFFCVFIVSRLIPIHRAYPGRILTPARFAWWSDFLGRRPRAITALFLSAMLVLALLAWPWSSTSPVGLKVDVDPFSFFGPENHLVKARKHFLDNGFGLYQLEVILIPHEKGRPPENGQPGDAVYAANQLAAQKYSDALRSRTDLGVLQVISTRAMRDRQAKFSADILKLQHEEGSLVDRLQSAGSQLLRLAKMTKYLKTFNETFDNWNRDKLDQGAIRLTFLAHDRVPGGFAEFVSLAKSAMPQNFDGYISGTVMSVVQLADGLVNGLAWGVTVSVIVMALVCAVLFRSARLAAIAAGPNAFPILVVYGYMGALGVPISSGSAMVATVSLGMNQTIYFLMRYRKLTREQGLDTSTALHEAFVQIGRPVVLTSLVFTAGFLIFLVSDFLPLYHFGLLTSIAMLAGMTGDVVLLPCLLRTFDRVPNRMISGPQESSIVLTDSAS